MKKSVKIFLSLTLISVLLVTVSISASAGYLTGPPELLGLQSAYVAIYYGSSTSSVNAALDQSMVVRTSAYTQGLDLADLICNNSPASNTKATIRFTWMSTDYVDFNAICFRGLPSDFKITVSVTGVSSMTGSSYSQDFSYVDQQDGWYLYDSYSSSATLTPIFSKIYTLSITIDGGSVQLKTLGDDNFILSLSLLPYNLSASTDLQYRIGYSDAQKYYKGILQTEKDNSFRLGEKKGYDSGYNQAEIDLEEEIYDSAYSDGYIEGRADGLAIAENGDLRDLIFAIPEAHLVALEGFTNWNLFDYNLYELLGGLVVLAFIAVIIKFGVKFVI